MMDLRRQGQSIGPVETQLALLDAGEVVGRHAGGKEAGVGSDGAGQLGKVLAGVFGQAKVDVGGGPGGRPQPFVEHQGPETGVAPAVGQMQITGTQGIADGESEGRLPDGAAQPTAFVMQDLAPTRRNKVGRRVVRQALDFPAIELPDEIDGPQQLTVSGVGSERQRQEGRQRFAQIRVAGEDGIDHAAAVLSGCGFACGDRAVQAVGAKASAQARHRLVLITGEHGLSGIDQRQQALLRRAPQTSGFRLGGVTGTAHQAGHVGIVGLHQVVEQSLAPIKQEADEQAVTLVGRKTPESAPIVPPAQLGEVPADIPGHIAKIGQTDQHGGDFVQLLAGLTGKASHRPRRWRSVTPEGGTAFGAHVIGHVSGQLVEGLAQR